MIGWVCYNGDDSWEERGRRMAEKLRSCLLLYPVKIWSIVVNERKVKVVESIHELPFWSEASINWNPYDCVRYNLNVAYRVCGRPCQRWCDNIR